MSCIYKNLLTLNLNKTKYLAFHKTRASQPPQTRSLKLHSQDCLKQQMSDQSLRTCNCYAILRSSSMKYLGVTLDDNLSFQLHISTLSSRIRKLIFVMKSLRYSATKETLLLVYKALCQSLILYCIRVWGGAAKTKMIMLERAQRAVLRVMLRKPFRYSTNDLYNEAAVLRVRQLYILRTTVSMLRTVRSSPDYNSLLKRRVFKVNVPAVTTAFAKRLPRFLFPFLFNKICQKLPSIKTSTSHEAKITIENWLLNLDYVKTEEILPVFGS